MAGDEALTRRPGPLEDRGIPDTVAGFPHLLVDEEVRARRGDRQGREHCASQQQECHPNRIHHAPRIFWIIRPLMPGIGGMRISSGGQLRPAA